jgi:zinc protease
MTRIKSLIPAIGWIALAQGPAAGAGPAPALPEGVRFVVSVEGIHEYRLANGLRVLLFPDPSIQTATVNITYFVGSLHEGYGETGMAHLLEHLMFKGTPSHPDVYGELTARGCRPNGSTWLDRTNYFETFTATDENLDWALAFEADRMVNSFISGEDLASEMTVVRNEFESGENDPAGILQERVSSTAYLWHNYGNTTIGARSDIENVPIERLRAFYRTWYRPDNAMLVVAGKFDPERTLRMIAGTFGKITPPADPVPALYTAEPAQDGERTVTLRRVGSTQAVLAAYHIPAGPHPDQPALEILALVLGDAPSGRLHRALVETGMAASVNASADRFRDPGLFSARAEVREGKPLEDVERELIRVTENAGSQAPAVEEVDRARAKLLNRWEGAIRNSTRAAIGLSEWAAMGDWRLLFAYRDRLRTVTPEEVRAAAERYLVPVNRTVGRFIPTEEPMRVAIPETPDLGLLAGGYSGGEGLAQGEEFDASPANIEARLVRDTLEAGMKLVLLPKKTRGETVNLSIQLHCGTEESLRGRAVAGELAADMLLRGTTTRTRQEIQDELNRLQANLRVFGSATGVNAAIEVPRAGLPDALRLVADVLRNPSFPENEFRQLVEEKLRGIEESRTDPRSLAPTRLQRHLYPYPSDHPSYTSTSEEKAAAVGAATLEQVEEFHRAFCGASAAEMAVAGDFDAAEVTRLAGDLFGAWKSREPYERIAVHYGERPAILEAIETPDKESAVLSAGIRIELGENDPDYPAMVLANFMTGGGFLNSRLATRIRGEEGLSYGVRSMFSANPRDRSGRLGAYAIYAPQNDAQILAVFREEIQKIYDSGFTAEEVAEAKSGWLQQQTVGRSQNRELARLLAARSDEGRTLEWDAKVEARASELTPEEIHAAFRRYVRPESISIVRAGDFAKAEGK